MARDRHKNRCGISNRNGEQAMAKLTMEYNFTKWLLDNGKTTAEIIASEVIREALNLKQPPREALPELSPTRDAKRHADKLAQNAKRRRQGDMRIVTYTPTGNLVCVGGQRMTKAEAWENFHEGSLMTTTILKHGG